MQDKVVIATGQRYQQVNPAPGYENLPEIIEIVGQDRLLGWWTVLSNFPGRNPRPMPAATILNHQVYRLLLDPNEKPGFGNPPNHREACWEDIVMQDCSAGPVGPMEREAFDHGYNSAMARCMDAVDTCRAIAEGAGIWGDSDKYPDYVQTLCRNAIAEIEPRS